jgi:hypothetical protein
MEQITVNGFTFVLSPSNRVIVKGGGIKGSGIDLGPISNFSSSSFLSNIKGVPAAADVQEQLEETAANNTSEIIAALQQKPQEEAAPPATAPAPVTEPGANASDTTTNEEGEAATQDEPSSYGADDDNTPSSPSQQGLATGVNNTNDGGNPQTATNQGSSNQESQKPSAAGKDSTIPGRRVYNPLSGLSSYTYNITLYLANPDAVSSLQESQFRNINETLPTSAGAKPQAYVIAQSGGVGLPANRAPGMPYDYYIEDLSFKTVLLVPNAPASGMNFEFKIIEPNSFSFPTKLVQAVQKLYQNSQLLNNRDPKKTPNPLDHHFILAVRFYGYDENGKVVDAQKFSERETMGATPDAIFERFYVIKITEFKFKLDGRATTYNIKAVPFPINEAYGSMRGIVPTTISCKGRTVSDLLTGENGLVTQLNSIQESLQGSNQIKEVDRYFIKFENGSDISPAPVSIAIKDKTNTVTSEVNTTKESNIQEAQKTVSLSKEVNIPISPTPILSAIDQIIRQSDYVVSALNQVNRPSEEEGDTESKAPTKNLNWYHVNPYVKPRAWDELRHAWAYDITYQIHEFKIPYLRSPYAGARAEYPGPHKKYEYWFTGKNSEIITYEQNYSGLFYLLFAQTSGPNKTNSDNVGSAPISALGGPAAPIDSSGGGVTGSQAAQIATSLSSPKDQIMFKATILGDPDYLTQSVGTDTLNQNFYKKFSAYSYDGFTINPNGGQVFIEINFKEAVDYNASMDPRTSSVQYTQENGLMGINSSIGFYNSKMYSDQAVQNGSMVYLLTNVVNSFSKGKFTQELNGVLVDPGAFFKFNAKTTPNSTNPRETSQANPVNTDNNRSGDLREAPQASWQPPYDFADQPPPNIASQTPDDDAQIQQENARLLARVPQPDSTREPPTFP